MAITHPGRTHARKNGNQRQRQTAQEEVRVNLGSGRFTLPGFINVDAFIEPEDTSEFRKGDLRNLPFESESVDYILCDNVLEHLPMRDVPRAVFEMRRILRPGGRCVIIVPDFADIARQWIEFDAGTFNPIMWIWFAEIIYGNQYHEGEYHRCPMSKGFLNYVIQTTGFLNYQMILYPMGIGMEEGKYPGVAGSKPGEILRNAMIIVDITK